MTTVVVDSLNREMAADRMACADGTIMKVTKIVTVFDETNQMWCCFASCGDYEHCSLFERWFLEACQGYKDDSTYPKDGSFNALVLYDDGTVLLYLSAGQPVNVQNRFHGIGSGADAALGALHMGATLPIAVKIAAKVDNGTGLGVQLVNLEKEKHGKRTRKGS